MLTVGDALAEIPTTKTGRPADFDEVYRILTSYKKGANKKKLVEGEYRWIQDGQ